MSVAAWYSPLSPFNAPIPASPAVDADSTAMVNSLVSDAATFGFKINVRQWTVPAYFADASTPKVTVSLVAGWAPHRSLSGVPVPAGAAPDPSGDGQMMVVDLSSGCEYDFLAARKTGGRWSADWANALPFCGLGVFPKGMSCRASGFALGAGLIRPEELAAGAIRHALVFSTTHTKAGGFVAPATQTDGTHGGSGAVPEGARVQLDPTLNLGAFGLSAWQATVAKALQLYGMFLGETGGFGLYAQHPVSAKAAYPWGADDFQYLPAALVPHLRVLTLGPLHPPASAVVPTVCGSFA